MTPLQMIEEELFGFSYELTEWPGSLRIKVKDGRSSTIIVIFEGEDPIKVIRRGIKAWKEWSACT